MPLIFKKGTNRAVLSLALAGLLSTLFFAIPTNIPLAGIPAPLIYPAVLLGNIFDTAVRVPQCLSILQGKSDLDANFKKRMAFMKEENKLPVINGKVDIYPAQINVLIASGLEYQPRPVIQSYLAYRQNLIKTNCQYLASDIAPEHIILQEMKDVYGFYPAMHDGPSWIEMLARYKPVWCAPTGLVLVKKTPLPIKFQKLTEQEASTGQSVRLSHSDKIVFAKIDLSLTAIGKLQKLFFRIYPPSISVTLKNGKVESFAAPTENLKEGFILSPYVCTTEELKNLFEDKKALAGNEITTMTIKESKNDFPWKALSERYKIELFSLESP